jgi:glycine dehydrogenase
MSDYRAAFVDRHIGPSASEQDSMLAELGYESLEALVDAAVPDAIREPAPLAIGDGASETEALALLHEMGDRNQVFTSLIGLGYYDTITPLVILRNVLENPAWYTAYTPYQPEISQGRLEALTNFQTMVTDLTGMEIANASMLDEATAAAEAMALLHRVNGKRGNVFAIDADCLPQTIEVVYTRAGALGIDIEIVAPGTAYTGDDCFGMLLQYPGASGHVRDYRALIAGAHERGTLVAVAADLLALTLLVPPGEMGADVVVGSSQRFGVPLGFGGPHAAFFATRDEYKRTLPGRLVGVSIDAEGRTAYRLALQTREQHIRREKATSNICTAQVLLAVIAGLYASYHGASGLRAIAERVHRFTCLLATNLYATGAEIVHDEYFDTITVRVPGRADEIADAARERRINLRVVDFDTLSISLDETTTIEIVGEVCAAFGGSLVVPAAILDAPSVSAIPAALQRTSEFLTHPVFSAHRSEHQMLRYLRALGDRDLALDRTMIPLGSCTMKLNATAEMEPITWPEWGRIHPFAPIEQAGGYVRLIDDLEGWLAEITGYDSVSLQPNAGSQGEFAGLIAIRLYHVAQGQPERDVCLIPASAHGTNAASASMAGMRVVVVKCDDNGNVDLGDLEAKATEHSDRLAALMVTYPSTHGVYEEHIGDICAVVHDHGGQVYLDGANLNALVGVARPGRFGADVSHINLHKTFCIPHGGGGPGVGPIGVRAHLAAFLPNHPLQPDAGPESGVAISAAPWGSAGILPISWAYVKMMGSEGLLRATQVAILNANYLAHRLAPHYPVLYTGAHGLVAHECIIDLRPISAETGVTVDDVAKRLIDYGFHAPTMSFPVAGTLMIEPTESEDRAEIDRFIDAMIAIRGEIDRVASGEWPADDNPLMHAPHTAVDVTSDAWARAYPRELAAFPVPALRQRKYWPPVGRIDSVYGDRNVMCTCPPIEAYED